MWLRVAQDRDARSDDHLRHGAGNYRTRRQSIDPTDHVDPRGDRLWYGPLHVDLRLGSGLGPPEGNGYGWG